VLVDDAGDIRICDFGLARGSAKTALAQQAMTTNIGTPAYLAPEMCNLEYNSGANGSVGYSPTVDVYAFAVLAWQLWYRRKPYSEAGARSAVMLVTMVLQGMRPVIDDGFPARLKPVIEACWSEDPEERPPFTELASLFENAEMDRNPTLLLLSERGDRPPQNPTQGAPPPPPPPQSLPSRSPGRPPRRQDLVDQENAVPGSPASNRTSIQ
jgi:serine/threonine protein kinase